jgi:hypothetical protein
LSGCGGSSRSSAPVTACNGAGRAEDTGERP